MQLHNKIDLTPCVTSIDYKKAEGLRKSSKSSKQDFKNYSKKILSSSL